MELYSSDHIYWGWCVSPHCCSCWAGFCLSTSASPACWNKAVSFLCLWIEHIFDVSHHVCNSVQTDSQCCGIFLQFIWVWGILDVHLDWQNTTACLPHSLSAQPSSPLPWLELAPRLAQGVFPAILFQYQANFLVYEVSLGKDGTGRVQRVLPKSR